MKNLIFGLIFLNMFFAQPVMAEGKTVTINQRTSSYTLVAESLKIEAELVDNPDGSISIIDPQKAWPGGEFAEDINTAKGLCSLLKMDYVSHEGNNSVSRNTGGQMFWLSEQGVVLNKDFNDRNISVVICK